MVCFRCLFLPLPLTWGVGTSCQASQLWISDCSVTSAVTRVTSWSLSPGYKSVETRGLIFLCCEHKPGETGGTGDLVPSCCLKGPMLSQDQNVTWRAHICFLPPVLEEPFVRLRTCRILVCVPPAFGDGSCVPHIYYMDTLTVHSLTHVTLYLSNFGHELSIRLQTRALWC